MTDLERRVAELRVNLSGACQLIETLLTDAEHGRVITGGPPDLIHFGRSTITIEGLRACLATFRSSIDAPALAMRPIAMVVLCASALVNSETDLATLGSTLEDLAAADPLWLEHMLDLVKVMGP
jgi:hypothetical protein